MCSSECRVIYLGKNGCSLTHRRPKPRAMIPRRISRVPPRSENAGATLIEWYRRPGELDGKILTRVSRLILLDGLRARH
jgi:hypothetical protein